jgi:hypothetical protein
MKHPLPPENLSPYGSGGTGKFSDRIIKAMIVLVKPYREVIVKRKGICVE